MLKIKRFISDPHKNFGASDTDVLARVDAYIEKFEIEEIVSITCEMFPVNPDRTTFQSQATLIYEE